MGPLPTDSMSGGLKCQILLWVLDLFPCHRSVRIDVTYEETGTNNWVTCGAEVQTQALLTAEISATEKTPDSTTIR